MLESEFGRDTDMREGKTPKRKVCEKTYVSRFDTSSSNPQALELQF